METQNNGMMVGSDMNLVEMPADSFERVVKGFDKPVIVEFWVKSCGNCQKFRSVYEKLPEIFSDKVEFLKINMFLSLENLKLAEGLCGRNSNPKTLL